MVLAESAKIESDEALNMGLVDRVTDLEVDVVGYAEEYLRQLAKDKSPRVIRSIKACILAQSSFTDETYALSIEQELFGRLWAGPVNLAAIQRFSS
jgi:enoyl-CoA hydratase/carnithine racemase